MVSSYLSEGLAKSLVKTLREAEERVRKIKKPIEGSPLASAGFVDGSYVLEERRGACLLLLSAATVVVRGGAMSGGLRGSREPIIHVLAPKTYSESRSSLLMAMLELTAAHEMVRQGVEAVFLDGSYTSQLMEPFGFAQDVYHAYSRLGRRVDWSAVEELGEKAAQRFEGLISGGEGTRRKLLEMLRFIGNFSEQLYQILVEKEQDKRGEKEALDFAVVYVEETAYLSALRALLDLAEASETGLFWVAKDTESRYITEQEGITGWLNDVMLLDYAWRGAEKVYTLLEGKEFGMPRGHVACRRLVEEVYGRWSRYGVAYFKLTRYGATMQASFPIFSREKLLDALETLASLADAIKGYPKPLNYVHNLAVLDASLPSLIADEIYRRAGSDDILKFMLKPSGRSLLGLK